MLGRDRSVWLQVAHGVESLAEGGGGVWREPAAVRKALGELLGVFPATHVQVDLAALLRAPETGTGWASLLGRSGAWGTLLAELALAISDAVRPPAVWGLGLPGPQTVAASLEDASERGVLKAGLQLASFLQTFREARVGFVSVDLRGTEPGGVERALASVFRNSGMYGWLRAVCVDGIEALGSSRMGAEVILLSDAGISELRPLWERGEPVGGGLGDAFWAGQGLAGSLPQRCLLYGEIPEGISPKAIVEAGRQLCR